MVVLGTLWWLLLWTAVGLCLGSFLNVVIYRLPRNRSLRAPVWSMCPHCRRRIVWYDNLPILSFILLRGRCRHCRVPIASAYLIIEAATAMVVLLLLDAFFIGQVRAGLLDSRFGLTDELSYDWPIFVGHIILFGCLLSMSAIDLEHYWVDVRFTNLATVAGFVLHALWTPRHAAQWIRPFDTTAVVSLFAVIGLGVVWLALASQPHVDGEDSGQEGEYDPAAETSPKPSHHSLASLYEPRSRAMAWACGIMLFLLFCSVAMAGLEWTSLRHGWRAMLPFSLFFVLIVRESTVVRESDQAIVEAIHEERHNARRMVMTEFALLVPAILFAWIGYQVMSAGGDLANRMSGALHATTSVAGVPMLRGWMPLYGLATAASGYVIAGAVGWAVRIVFTLLFGKEAFGSGDIHLMAAAGCIAGWPVVVAGFALTCGLALIGWVLTLPFKRTRALPLGPWLSLSFLVIVIFYERMLKVPVVARAIDLTNMLLINTSQP